MLAALENVLRLTGAMHGAIELAMQAAMAVEFARRNAPPLSMERMSRHDDPMELLRGLQQLAREIEAIAKDPKSG